MLYCGVRVPLLLANCSSLVEIQVKMIFAVFTKATRLIKKSNLYIFPDGHEDIDD